MRFLFTLIGCALFLCGCRPDQQSVARPVSPYEPLLAAMEKMPPADSAETLWQTTCALCHGAEGLGNEGLLAPPLAGMPAWYLRGQLESFHQGFRGQDPDDPASFAMHRMAVILPTNQFADVTAFASRLPRRVPTDPVLGDAAAGKQHFEDACIDCHRFNASGELVFGSPPLTPLPPWYIHRQFAQFRAGRRGAHPQDPRGAKMREIAMHQMEPDGLTDIIAYIRTLAEDK